MEWNDYRLVWNQNDYDGIPNIYTTVKDLDTW